MVSFIKRTITKLVQLESSDLKLTLGSCLGVYIAFSPFVGFHTAMVFLFAWLFGLNVMVLLSVSMMINNPWTMVPVYGAGYWFGDVLLSFLGINHHACNPAWVDYINAWWQAYVSTHGFSFWAFMIGGNILGILISILCYPFIRWLIRSAGRAGKKKVMQTVACSKKAVRGLQKRAKPMIDRVKRSKKQDASESSSTK